MAYKIEFYSFELGVAYISSTTNDEWHRISFPHKRAAGTAITSSTKSAVDWEKQKAKFGTIWHMQGDRRSGTDETLFQREFASPEAVMELVAGKHGAYTRQRKEKNAGFRRDWDRNRSREDKRWSFTRELVRGAR